MKISEKKLRFISYNDNLFCICLSFLVSNQTRLNYKTGKLPKTQRGPFSLCLPCLEKFLMLFQTSHSKLASGFAAFPKQIAHHWSMIWPDGVWFLSCFFFPIFFSATLQLVFIAHSDKPAKQHIFTLISHTVTCRRLAWPLLPPKLENKMLTCTFSALHSVQRFNR